MVFSHISLKRSIINALAFLVNSQQEDGGFPVMRWDRDGTSVSEDRLFGTACILLAVGELLPSASRRAALTLLEHRRGINGFWHFDAAGNLPADADDTACALAALMRFAPTLEKPNCFDADRLTAFVHPSGRIITWLTANGLAHPATDDVVVVANVIYAMALCDISSARYHFARWLALNASNSGREVISNEAPHAINLTTPYYIHIEAVEYAWARTLRTLGISFPSLTSTCVSSASPLRCALALAASEVPQNELISFLLQSQQYSGCWEAEPWFRSPGATFGSAALTTAFAVEAFSKW